MILSWLWEAKAVTGTQEGLARSVADPFTEVQPKRDTERARQSAYGESTRLNLLETSENDLNMNRFSEFHAKSILICPDHFAFEFNSAVFFSRRNGYRDHISFRQKQIGLNKCTLVAQVFNKALVDAVSSRKKWRLRAKFSRILSFIYHYYGPRFR